MESALTYTLQRVHWQVFGSLTFLSWKVPDRVRVHMWFQLVRDVCRWFRVPDRFVIWALRQEPGEITGRLHFHFLLAGLPPEAVHVATLMAIKAQWEIIGGGMARVRRYVTQQSDLQGLDYILKCLGVKDGGANLYEVGKFTHSADQVILSNSFTNPMLLNRVSDRLVSA